MARPKQRENYRNGSVVAETVKKLDKDGNQIMDKDGKPVRVQIKDKDGKPVWRVCISLGTEQYLKDGKVCRRQRKVQRRYSGTLTQAREYARQLTDEYSTVDVDKTTCTFSQLVKAWEKKRPTRCSDRQFKLYCSHLSYLAPCLDGKPIVELKKSDIESALAAVSTDRGFSPTTTNKLLQIASRVFEFGIDNDYLIRNPCRGIELAETDAKERHALSEDEAYRLREALDKAEFEAYGNYYAKEARQLEEGNAFDRSSVRDLSNISMLVALRLILATGMRRGEALGLAWEDIDLARGTVHVGHSLNIERTRKAPKTGSGKRNLFIDTPTLEHLRVWRGFLEEQLQFIKDSEGNPITLTGKTPAFPNNVGGWLDPSKFARTWRKLRRELGFDGLLVHEMRNTQVTILLGNGIDISMVQNRIGHARPSTVTLQYLDEIPAHDEEAAALMGWVLYGFSDDLRQARKTA